MSQKNTDRPLEEIAADFGAWSGTVFFRLWSARQRREVLAKREDATSLAVEVVFRLAKDETGARRWTTGADRDMIETEFDVNEIDRVAGYILEKMTPPPAGN